jgi:hypothetical protein
MRTELIAVPGGNRPLAPRDLGDLEKDERGAILVLGIFMCACMVGALWYLAGIGSAIVYRERMQEAADAVAFSGAVLHARGMNLIVLINFVMAAILAIRVALRVTQLALVIVGTILSLIPFVGAGLAAPFFGGAEGLESPIGTTRPLINNALKALSKVQTAIARIVPPAALVGSYQVGERYTPVVNNSVAGSPIAVADGLPIAEDTEDKLCRKAGEAVGSVLTMAAPIPKKLADAISGMLGRLVAAGGAYFCEMGTGGGPPDVSSDLDRGAEEACDKELDRLRGVADQARRRYDDKCLEYDCTLTTPTAAQQAELDALARDRDIADQKVRDFDRDQCIEDKKREGRDRFNQKTGGGNTPPASANNGQGMTPKRVKDGWKNGIKDAQVLSAADGNLASLKAAEVGGKAGAWRTPVNFRVPTSAAYSIAQAEYFFDCSGAWTSSDCEGEKEAMWRFRWRARLRRFNSPFGGIDQVANILAGADAFKGLTDGAVTTGFQNAALQLELAGIITRGIANRDLIIH